MNKYILLSFLLILLFFIGCNSKPQQTTNTTEHTKIQELNTSSNNQEINNQTIENNEGEEENEEILNVNIMNYVQDESAPLFIRFFNVGQPYQHGRLIIISKTDFNIVDAEIENETDVVTINSALDDAEIFIMPTIKNVELCKKIIDDVLIGKLILPDYDNEKVKEISSYASSKGIDVIHVKYGDKMTFNGINITFYGPYPGELSSDENNAVIFEIRDRRFSFLFLNDALDGELQKLNQHIKHNYDGIEVPNYGIGITTGPIMLLFDKTKPSFMILDGYKECLREVGLDSRNFFREYAKIRKIPIYDVWTNNGLTITYDGVTYAIQ